MLLGTILLGILNLVAINLPFLLQGLLLLGMSVLAFYLYGKHSYFGPIGNTTIAACWIAISGFHIAILIISVLFILETVILISLTNKWFALISMGLSLGVLLIYRIINPIATMEAGKLPEIKALNLVIERYKMANDYAYSLSSNPLQVFCCPSAKCKDQKPDEHGFYSSQMYGSYQEFHDRMLSIFEPNLLDQFLATGLVQERNGLLYCQEGGREKDPTYIGQEEFSKVSIDENKIVYSVRSKYLAPNAPATCKNDETASGCSYLYRIYTITLEKINKQWVVSNFVLAY